MREPTGAATPSRSERADDGCNELREAIRTAFPQLTRREVEHVIGLARRLNGYAAA